MDNSQIARKYFQPEVEIIVDDDFNKITSLYVDLDFALFLKVGDVLFFEEENEEQPKWIISCDKWDELYDCAITLTQRNLHTNRLAFYAKLS